MQTELCGKYMVVVYLQYIEIPYAHFENKRQPIYVYYVSQSVN